MLLHLRQYDEAETLLWRAIEKLAKSADSRHLSEALSELGQVLMATTRLEEAKGVLETSSALCLKAGLQQGEAIVEGLIGDLDLLEGRTEDGIRGFAERLLSTVAWEIDGVKRGLFAALPAPILEVLPAIPGRI